jgi:regulator of protease activity HflC (stomatin/prohibitin superfamily)
MALGETIGGGMNVGGGMIKTAAGGALAIAAGANTFFRVREGEVAIKEGFGGKVRRDNEGNPKIYGPGVHMVFPGFQHRKVISIQDRQDDYPEFEISRDNKKYKIESSLMWGVSPENDNPYRALYVPDTIKTLENRILRIGRGMLWSALMEADERIFSSANLRDEIYEPLEERVRKPFIKYGVEMRDLDIIASETDSSLLSNAIRESNVGNGVLLAAVQGMNGNGEQIADGNGSDLQIIE